MRRYSLAGADCPGASLQPQGGAFLEGGSDESCAMSSLEDVVETLNGWQALARTLKRDGRAVIGGRRVEATTHDTFASRDPQTDDEVARFARCAAAEVDHAVASSRHALSQGHWSDPALRTQALHRLADLVRQHRHELALMDSLEMGMPISGALADVALAAEGLHETADLQGALADELLATLPRTRALNRRVPHGVVGLITPWNFPLFVALGKVGAALAAANAVVLKPSEVAPLSALRLADLALEAGVPPGVFNALPGLGAEAGDALARHMDVDALSFTGSTETGRRLMRAAADSNLKALVLECGGKSPQVVFDDFGAPELLADALVQGCTWNSGQVCVAGTRLLVAQEVAERLRPALAARLAACVSGHPLDPATTLGPLGSRAHAQRVRRIVRDALASGAKPVGEWVDDAEAGHLRPIVLDAVQADSAVVQQEVFGPVATLQTFANADEAIALANGTPYGLSATAWTADPILGERLAYGLRAGLLMVNGSAEPDASAVAGVTVEPVGCRRRPLGVAVFHPSPSCALQPLM
jgi:4-guanidinobutyraldehyde dehydrogenase / NAD-dependent aldehyde dehydrogenase